MTRNPATFEEIKIGTRLETPRFCTVKISALFETEQDARSAGYTEPTHLYDLPYKVVGKSIDMYHMKFAAFKMA